jgi:hypothetical protein
MWQSEGWVDREKDEKSALRRMANQHKADGDYFIRGGLWFGLIFGLSFGLIVWGRDIYYVLKNSVVLPWVEFVAGLLLCVLGWAIAGYLSGFVRSVGWEVFIFIVVAVATPWLVWAAKVLGENSCWLKDHRNWSFIIHFGEAVKLRILFTGLWGIGIGGFAGILQRWLIPHAWDYTTSGGRTSIKSLGVFLLCLPLTILFGSVTTDMLHKDFHETMSAAYQGLRSYSLEETRRPFLTWRYGNKDVEVHTSWQWPQGDFTIHIVDYDADTLDQFFFDAVFDDGPTVRCQGGSASIQFCGDITDFFEQQMVLMIESGLHQEIDDLQCELCDPHLEPEVVMDLKHLAPDFTESYQVTKSFQYGGAVTMMASFDTGYELTCNFRGEDPIVVDSCTGQYRD